MKQAKYKIQNADLVAVEKWLRNRIAETRRFPHGRPMASVKAVEAFHQLDKSDPTDLNDWCEEHLNARQWDKMKLTIRAYRLKLKRVDDEMLDVKRIAVSILVHEKLKHYADVNKLNLSQAIDELLLSQRD